MSVADSERLTSEDNYIICRSELSSKRMDGTDYGNKKAGVANQGFLPDLLQEEITPYSTSADLADPSDPPLQRKGSLTPHMETSFTQEAPSIPPKLRDSRLSSNHLSTESRGSTISYSHQYEELPTPRVNEIREDEDSENSSISSGRLPESLMSAMSMPPNYQPPATPSSTDATPYTRPPTRSLPLEPLDTNEYMDPISTLNRHKMMRNGAPRRSPTTLGSPPNTALRNSPDSVSGGIRRENPLYNLENNADLTDDPQYSTMYNIYSTSNEYSANGNSCSCKSANHSSIPSKSDDSIKQQKQESCCSLSCGIAWISLLVALVALAMALLLSFGILRVAVDQSHIALVPPTIGSITSEKKPDNNQTVLELQALSRLITQLNFTTISQSQLIMQLNSSTYNQSETIEQLLLKVADLEDENNQLQTQINSTIEASISNTITTNNNTQSLKSVFDWLISLNHTLFELISSSATADTAFVLQLYGFDNAFNQTIESISTEIKGLRRFDPTLCRYDKKTKIYSGNRNLAETPYIANNQNETIVSASCSFYRFNDTQLMVESTNGFNTYHCQCSGGDVILNEDRFCYLDYWICPNEAPYN